MQTEIEYRQTIEETLRGYQAAQVMITCTQLDIFGYLAAGPQTAPALAAKTQAQPEAMIRLLNAAVALGWLVKEGEAYANTPLAATCLAQEGPYFMGNFVRRAGDFYQRWSHLPDVVRTGQCPRPPGRPGNGCPRRVRDLALSLYDLARVTGPVVAETLALPADRPLRVLDIGGGHGGYSMALARRYPQVEAVVFELPAAAEVARDLIAAEGLAGRVAVRAGDFRRDDLGRDFDLALLFGVLAGQDPAGKVALLRKAHAALSPGGMVVVREFQLDPDRTGPPKGALFSLQMLLSSRPGDLSTPSDMASWLTEAGFVEPGQMALPAWMNSRLDVAYRPEPGSRGVEEQVSGEVGVNCFSR